MDRDFKGIWIPKEIWLSKDLTLQEKIFYVEIDSLDNEEGCFATNSYFSEFFEISKTRVSLVIKSLIDKKYITSTIIYKEGTKEILKRVLNISYRPYLIKVKDPIQQKLKDNNTLNNTSNNILGIDGIINNYTTNIVLRTSITDFIKMRKAIKKPMTDRALILLLTELDKLSKNDDEKIKILNQSIVSSWSSVYALKTDMKVVVPNRQSEFGKAY